MQFILQHKNCSPIVRASSTKGKWIFPGGGQTKGNLCQDVVIPEETRGCWLQLRKVLAFQWGEIFAAHSIANTCLIGTFIFICSFIEQA